MICPHCGKEQTGDICTNCGARLTSPIANQDKTTELPVLASIEDFSHRESTSRHRRAIWRLVVGIFFMILLISPFSFYLVSFMSFIFFPIGLIFLVFFLTILIFIGRMVGRSLLVLSKFPQQTADSHLLHPRWFKDYSVYGFVFLSASLVLSVSIWSWYLFWSLSENMMYSFIQRRISDFFFHLILSFGTFEVIVFTVFGFYVAGILCSLISITLGLISRKSNGRFGRQVVILGTISLLLQLPGCIVIFF